MVKQVASRLSDSFYTNYASSFMALEIYSETPLYGHLVYCGHFFWPGKTAIGFLTKKPSLIRSPVNTANGHILKSQIVESDNLTPVLKYGHSSEISKIKMPVICEFH